MREYLIVFLVAATVTYLLGVVAREIALRTGAVAKVRDLIDEDFEDQVLRADVTLNTARRRFRPAAAGTAPATSSSLSTASG